MIEHLLIGLLAAVLVPGTQVLHIHPVQIPDPLIHPSLELFHGWQVGGYGVRCPYIGGGDPVQRQIPGKDHIQHLQTVLAVGNPCYVFGHFRHLTPPRRYGTAPWYLFFAFRKPLANWHAQEPLQRRVVRSYHNALSARSL